MSDKAVCRTAPATPGLLKPELFGPKNSEALQGAAYLKHFT